MALSIKGIFTSTERAKYFQLKAHSIPKDMPIPRKSMPLPTKGIPLLIKGLLLPINSRELLNTLPIKDMVHLKACHFYLIA